MKKLILGIGSIVCVVAPIASVLSCGVDSQKDNGKETNDIKEKITFNFELLYNGDKTQSSSFNVYDKKYYEYIISLPHLEKAYTNNELLASLYISVVGRKSGYGVEEGLVMNSNLVLDNGKIRLHSSIKDIENNLEDFNNPFIYDNTQLSEFVIKTIIIK